MDGANLPSTEDYNFDIELQAPKEQDAPVDFILGTKNKAD